MRILYLTQYFPPEMGAPQARIPDLMQRMIALGHSVTILTAMPNYPGGKVFTGYRWRVLKIDGFAGMRVVRTWIYATKSLNPIKRGASQLSFALSSVLFGTFLARKHEIMMVGSPPLILALAGIALRTLLRIPYVAVVADLWPEVAISTGMLRNPVGITVAKWLERLFYKKALAVVTQTHGQAANIKSRFPSARVQVISGGVDTTKFAPAFRSEEVRLEFGVSGKVGVLYSGLHGFAQGLDVVIRAAAMLQHCSLIHFVMIGDGVVKEELVKQASQLRLENLAFYDPVPRERMPAILASMDIALVTLRKGVPAETIPSKLYEAMASAVPIIAAVEGEAASLIEDGQFGVVVKPGAADELRDAIEQLANDKKKRLRLGTRGLNLARSRFDRDSIARGLRDLLMNLTRSLASQ